MIWSCTGAVAVVLISCLTTAASHSDQLTLVSDGQPSSIIVITDDPTSSARAGAEELQSWLQKASGAIVPIMPESQVADETDKTLILVGDTKRTAGLGLQSDSFGLEEICIRTFPGVLVIMGDDERPNGMGLNGSLWAVETFAEQFLNVVYLWPGPLGEAVSRSKTISVGQIDIRKIPALRQRKIRNTGYNERVQRGLDYLGWSAEDFKKHHAESVGWFQFHRIGGSFRGEYGHAFGDYWERFHEEHPDWFALQPDGTRDNSRAAGRARLCVSNRELIEQVARDRIAEMRKRPTWDTISVSPNDGGYATFCQCESCKAWDAPNGEMIETWGPDGPLKHVSLTDRFVRFYSAVAEIVAREFPDRYLGAYAYSAYTLPPVHAKLHPNVVIGLVNFTYLNEQSRQKARDSWVKWSQATDKLFWRPNLLTAGMGFPTVYVHRLAEDFRFCAGNGMMFTDFDCCYQHWAANGINYYVLARLLWEPDADVDTIIDDYCRAGFGSASDPIREYFIKLEEMTTELAESNLYEGRKQSQAVIARMYTDEFLADCNALLDEASRKAEDDTIRQRVDFLRKGIEYARIRRDWALAKHEKKPVEQVKNIEAERDEWFQQLGISWALNAPYLRFYGY